MGGNSTKIHVVGDALGLPIRFLLSGGEAAEISIAPSRVAGLEGEYLLADKVYASDAFVKAWEADGMTVLIPSRENRLEPREIDSTIYQERNAVERLCSIG